MDCPTCVVDISLPLCHTQHLVSEATLSGERLRVLRNAARLTQHDLATKLRRRGFGTTQTTVSRWEDGQLPHSSVLSALADELGVSLADLLGTAAPVDPFDAAKAELADALTKISSGFGELADIVETLQGEARAAAENAKVAA